MFPDWPAVPLLNVIVPSALGAHLKLFPAERSNVTESPTSVIVPLFTAENVLADPVVAMSATATVADPPVVTNSSTFLSLVDILLLLKN
jgi:hypothetical protein